MYDPLAVNKPADQRIGFRRRACLRPPVAKEFVGRLRIYLDAAKGKLADHSREGCGVALAGSGIDDCRKQSIEP